MNREPTVLISGLVHEFVHGGETLEVLKNIDLSAEKGEFLTIIGPSGCGKTTLLNIIAGLLKPTRVGALLIEGAPVTKPNPDKVALVFQDSGLLYWRNVQANVEFGLELRGIPREQRREQAERYLRLVGLDNFGKRYPSQLSGGMKQRVALARALTLETPILLLDEPFGALDEQTRLLMAEELLRVCSDGQRTVIFVTHSLQEAAILSDRIVVLTSRPASVRKVIELEGTRPRTRERADAIREELWDLLKGESMRAMEEDGDE
jgi:NitT/TauT family transport system ATP-binding protein